MVGDPQLLLLKQDALAKSGIAPQLVSHLKQCAIALVKPESRADIPTHPEVAGVTLPKAAGPKIDKSVLALGEPKRIRCKEHLRFVASQPCLICGRSPSHAHHLRYAQSKGLSLKVSDEFTVCRFAPSTITTFTTQAGSKSGGKSARSILSKSLAAFGNKGASSLPWRTKKTS